MALGNRGPIRFDANGKLDPAILAGVFALRLLRLRRRAEARRTRRHRTRRRGHAGARAGDARRSGRRARTSRARRRLPRAEHQLGEAVVGSARRNRPRERPPSGEDVRTGGAGRSAGVRGAADSRLAAVFRCVSARLRSSRSARGRGGRERRRLHAVQRSGVDQAGAARRFGGVASGRLDALGQRRNSTKARTASTSWRSCTAATRRTGCGWCRVRIAQARPTSRRWSTRPVRIACPTRCR